MKETTIRDRFLDVWVEHESLEEALEASGLESVKQLEESTEVLPVRNSAGEVVSWLVQERKSENYLENKETSK